MFALCDCNAFYCSCEAVFQPRLRGLPVVVLSNNDGCAIARSAEAKALGIPMGAPAFQWRDFFQEHRVQVFSSNYALYGDMSRRVMSVLREHAAAVEVYSIDEAFLSLEGMAAGQMEAHAKMIRETVRRWTGIPIGVGVASSKLLAKLANRQAKKTGGVCVFDYRSTEGQALLDAWPCGELWGVAGRLAARLERLGIRTAGELSRAPRTTIRKQFGVVGRAPGVGVAGCVLPGTGGSHPRPSEHLRVALVRASRHRLGGATPGGGHARGTSGREDAAARVGGVGGVRVPANRPAPGGPAAVPSAGRARAPGAHQLHPGTGG